MKQQKMNEYDDTKRMLNIIRNIKYNDTKLMREQETPVPAIQNNTQNTTSNNTGEEDFNVINDVEVVIHGDDPTDTEVTQEEKGKISQIIDSFRTEVSELTEFGKLHIYDNDARLEGKVGNMNLNFMLSAGDESGVYLTNLSSLQITDETLDMINRLKKFEPKFTNTINDVILTRRQT